MHSFAQEGPWGGLFFFHGTWGLHLGGRHNSETHWVIKCPMIVQDAPSTFIWHTLCPCQGHLRTQHLLSPKAPPCLHQTISEPWEPKEECVQLWVWPNQAKSPLLFKTSPWAEAVCWGWEKRQIPTHLGVHFTVTINSLGLRDLQHQLPTALFSNAPLRPLGWLECLTHPLQG